MFPPGSFGVGVTVAELHPALWGGVPLPAGVVSSRPSRLGDLLPVGPMTAEQKAARVQRAKSVLAAYEAELVVGLATDRPASDDRQRGQAGAASGEWAGQLLDEGVSEFFPDELALVLNCSRAAATQLWEHSTTLCRRLPATWAALADGELDWPRVRVIAAELITADPAAADRRRRQAQREADVTVRGLGDGMGELRARMPYPDAAQVRAVVDAHARAARGAGDGRPIGQLRGAVTPDGVLTVTTPTGVIRTTRPPGVRPDDTVLRATAERLLSGADPPSDQPSAGCSLMLTELMQ